MKKVYSTLLEEEEEEKKVQVGLNPFLSRIRNPNQHEETLEILSRTLKIKSVCPIGPF